MYHHYCSHHVYCCVSIRKKYKSAFASHPEKSTYNTVGLSTGTITKNDLELPAVQPNPVYAVGDNMTMDSNPAYKTRN